MRPAALLLLLACEVPQTPVEEPIHPFLRLHQPSLTCPTGLVYHRAVLRYCASPTWCVEERCLDTQGVAQGPAVTRDGQGVLFARGHYRDGARSGLWAVRKQKQCDYCPPTPEDDLSRVHYPR